MSPLRRSTFAHAAALAVLCFASPAIAQTPTDPSANVSAKGGAAPSPEASQRFRRGIELYKEGDFTSALMEFRRAYELAPNYRVLYNIGQVHAQLKDYVRAIEAFRKYVEGGAQELGPDKQKALQAEIRKLEERVARVTVHGGEPGVAVEIDDEPPVQTPLAEPVLLNPGRHRIVASKEGYRRRDWVLDLAAGDAKTVEVALEKEAASPTVAVNESQAPTPTPKAVLDEPPQQERSRATPLFWASAGTAVAAGGAAAVTGILALGAKSERDEALKQVPGDPDKLKELEDRARTLAITSDVLLGVSVVGAGVAAIAWFSGPSKEPAPARSGRTVVTFGPGSIGASSTF